MSIKYKKNDDISINVKKELIIGQQKGSVDRAELKTTSRTGNNSSISNYKTINKIHNSNGSEVKIHDVFNHFLDSNNSALHKSYNSHRADSINNKDINKLPGQIKYVNRRINNSKDENTLGSEGADAVTSAKRITSQVDENVRKVKTSLDTSKKVFKTGIQTGKNIKKGASKLQTLLKDRKNIFTKNNVIKLVKNNFSKEIIKNRAKKTAIGTVKGTKEVSKYAGKTLTIESLRGAKKELENEDNDLVIKSINDGVENAKTAIEITRRVKHTIGNISTRCENKKVQTLTTKDHNRIMTLAKNNRTINTKIESSIKIKNIISNNKINTSGENLKYKQKFNTTSKTKNIKLKNRANQELKESLEKTIKIIIKKTAELVKTKLAVILAIVLVIFLLLTLINGMFTSVVALSVPNIDNPDEWKTEMNRIEAKANNIISSGDKFKVIDNRQGEATSWKQVIAVYMAKYENDPPNNFGRGEKTDIEDGTDSSEKYEGDETTFTGTYSDIINLAYEKTGVDPYLISAVIYNESKFQPNAVSSVGAMGLMQLMPDTAASYGVTNPFDPYQNIMGGSQLLQVLNEQFNGDLTMILIGYNLGVGNMQKYGINSAADLYKTPAETRAYVPAVLAIYDAYKNGKELPEGEVTGVVSEMSGSSNELEKIYNSFNTLTRSESKKKHDDGSETTIITITLTKHNMDYVMDKINLTDDQKEIAKLMIEADAFKDVIPDFDFNFKIRGNNTGSTTNADIGISGAVGSGEALNEAGLQEVKKYIDECIGTPYQMGGTQPGVALDCSGFVSYVFTQTGYINGRYTAQGLSDISTKVDEADLKPGDLIFFQGTYNCSDTVTHVGIYVGNGMMAHSGNPCQYASYESAYWQEHLYGYGRLT